MVRPGLGAIMVPPSKLTKAVLPGVFTEMVPPGMVTPMVRPDPSILL